MLIFFCEVRSRKYGGTIIHEGNGRRVSKLDPSPDIQETIHDAHHTPAWPQDVDFQGEKGSRSIFSEGLRAFLCFVDFWGKSTDDITIRVALTGDELREAFKRPLEMPLVIPRMDGRAS